VRDLPLIERKRRLARLFDRAKRRSIRFVEHLTGDGPTVFAHMGLEGIVSKRTDAPYRSGPSKTWLKSKNPASKAVRCAGSVRRSGTSYVRYASIADQIPHRSETTLTGESATNGQARDDPAASLLTLDLIRAADDAPSSDSPYPTSRTMRSFNG
jgi:hypothetical protein